MSEPEVCARCGERIPVAMGRERLLRQPLVVQHATEAACIEALKRPAWRPIETAPMDGTEVLVRYELASVEFVHVAWYRSREEWEKDGKDCGWDTLEEWLGWWSYTYYASTQEMLTDERAPTHWAPKPEVPR